MLKLGKFIIDIIIFVEIFNVDMLVMVCIGRLIIVDFFIEFELFGIGGFCKVFKVIFNDRGFNGLIWVVKRYLEKVVVDIIVLYWRVYFLNILIIMGVYVRVLMLIF